MCAKSDYGKKARTGWTRAFEESWDKSLGKRCEACSGLGYYWDECDGKAIKQYCLLCGGKGVRKE